MQNFINRLADADLPIVTLNTVILSPIKNFLFIGPTQSGKTNVMLDILCHMRQYYYYGLAFSPTLETRQSLSTIIPPILVHTTCNVSQITSFMRFAQQMVGRYGKDDLRTRCFIIFDDISADKTLLHSQEFDELLCNGRHYGIAVFVTVQYIKHLLPSARGNMHHIFMQKILQRDFLSDCYDAYFSDVPKIEFLGNTKSIGFYQKATEKYRSIVKIMSPDLAGLDSIFYHKSPPFKNQGIRLCAGFIWYLNDLLYADVTKSEENINQLTKKRRDLLQQLLQQHL